ncbi:MAG: type II secretion system F family protein, partial [candidate division WOR-3 bacterium]
MIIAALILLGIAAFLILAQARASRARKTRARATDAEKVPEFYEAIRPMVTQFALLTRLIPLPGIRERYAHQLERAGLPFEMSADEFLALKLLILLIATTFAILVYSVLIPNWAVVLVLVAFGFFLPDLRLYDMVKTQERAYLRGLPGFLDLLALAVEAGLGFDAAVRKLTEILEPSPLTRGFQAFLRNMNVGLTRAEALREMARKLDLPDFDSFAHAVIQATESGA